jgi:hypothetical protein
MDRFSIGQFALGVLVLHLILSFGVRNHLRLRFKKRQQCASPKADLPPGSREPAEK